ncbi:MAG: cytochrome P450 [Burkholderiaceae bacterium]
MPHTTPASTHPANPDLAATLAFSLAAAPAGFIDDPYPWYAALRRHAPVHRLAADSLLLTRCADLMAVYRHPGASSDKKREFAPKYGPGSPLFEHHTTSLVFSDPPLHTRVRRLLTGALNQRAVARIESGLIELVDGLIDRLATLSQPDLIRDFAARIPVEVIGSLLDVPRDEREPLQGWSIDILSALEPVPGATLLERGNRSVTDFLNYLRDLVARRRQQPGDPEVDMLTRLILGETDGERLSELELLHNCIFLLNAGHETTTNLIGNGLEALMRHRDQLDRLVRDPALIGTAVEELLRFESPLQLNNRLATTAIDLPADPITGRGVVTIEAGTFVTLGVGAANRDPEVFAEPDRLDIGRRPNPQLAFGHGAHACAGMNIARLEARVAIGRLVARYPGIESASPPERDRRIRFRGFRTLPVVLNRPASTLWRETRCLDE